MKNKAILSLMLIGVMVLSSTIVLATTYDNGSLANNGWTITSGTFGGTFGTGVFSTITTTGYARAVLPMNQNANGTHAFDAQFRFKLNNNSEGIWFGVANTSNATNNQLIVGWPGHSAQGFATSIDGTSFSNMTPNKTPDKDTEYIAHVTSSNGNSITFTIETTLNSVIAGPVTLPMPNGRAAYLVIQIDNCGPISITPSFTLTPIVNWVKYTDNGGGTPSASPSVSPSATAQSATAPGPNAIRDFYASQPATHMSDANAVRNANGTYSIPNGMGQVKYGVSGTVMSATGNTPIVGATVKLGSNTQVTGSNGGYKFNDVVPGKYNVTASANGYSAMTKNVDATAANAVMNFALQSTAGAPTPVANATAVATTPAAASPTKTQSPGFGIVLVAMGMILAGAFITRKKK